MSRLDLAATVDWTLSERLDLRYRIYSSRYEKDRVVYALPYADLGYASQADSTSSENRSTLRQGVHELTSVWAYGRRPHPGWVGLEHRKSEVESTAFDSERIFKSAFAQHEWQIVPRFQCDLWCTL